jgi:hypothetical protein
MSITLMQETCLWNLAEWKQVERVLWSPTPPIPRRADILKSSFTRRRGRRRRGLLPSREEEDDEDDEDEDENDEDEILTLTLTLIILAATTTVIMNIGVKEAKFYPGKGNSK